MDTSSPRRRLLDTVRSTLADRAPPARDVEVSGDLPLPDVVRPKHILAAWHAPTSTCLLEHEDAQLALVTRRSDDHDFVLLVVASLVGEAWRIADVFRVYGATAPSDPVETFVDVLDRYGEEFTVAGRRTRFTPFARVRISDTTGPRELIGALELDPHKKLRLNRSWRASGEEIHLAWVYFLDIGRYEIDVRRRSRR